MTLKKMRLDCNLTQEDVANRLGYASKSGYNLMENGKVKPSIEQIVKLSEIFNMSISDIVDAVK